MKRFIVVLLFCALLVQAAWMQPPADDPVAWQVLLYDQGQHAIISLDAAGGIETITLPDAMLNLPGYDVYRVRVHIAPDQNRAVIHLSYAAPDQPHVDHSYIVNLNDPRHFMQIPPLYEDAAYFYYQFGAFSPDGRQVALSYVVNTANGGFVIVDLASADFMLNMYLPETMPGSTVTIGDWTAEGITFFPVCTMCAPPDRFVYQRWNPETGVVETTNHFTDRSWIDRFKPTGECLYTRNHAEFPLGLDYLTVYLYGRNVVQLLHEGEIPDMSGGGQIVYYNGDHLDIGAARWTTGGRAFIVPALDWSWGELVFRDGATVRVTFPPQHDFLAPTGAGWLMQDLKNHRVYHYIYADGALHIDLLGDFAGVLQPIDYHITLNEDLEPLLIDIQPPDEFFCPGTVLSRLQVGDAARVLSDGKPDHAFVHLYIGDEIASSQERITLSEGDVLHILEGPECWDRSYLWKAEFEGKIGWVHENDYKYYILEPLD